MILAISPLNRLFLANMAIQRSDYLPKDVRVEIEDLFASAIKSSLVSGYSDDREYSVELNYPDGKKVNIGVITPLEEVKSDSSEEFIKCKIIFNSNAPSPWGENDINLPVSLLLKKVSNNSFEIKGGKAEREYEYHLIGFLKGAKLKPYEKLIRDYFPKEKYKSVTVPHIMVSSLGFAVNRDSPIQFFYGEDIREGLATFFEFSKELVELGSTFPLNDKTGRRAFFIGRCNESIAKLKT